MTTEKHRSEETNLAQSKTCPVCNSVFNRPKDYGNGSWEKRVCCSHKCAAQLLKQNYDYTFDYSESYRDLKLSYLLSRTIKTTNGCIEWTGYRDSNGYGQACVYGKKTIVCRHIYHLSTGIDPGLYHILHTCDNPSCVNIDHLFLGTNLDNIKDRMAKGRGQRKITIEEKEAIISLIKNGVIYKIIAEQFNVSGSLINYLSTQNGLQRGRGFRHKITPYQKNDIISMIKENMTYAAIAEKYNLSKAYIQYVAAQQGIRRRNTYAKRYASYTKKRFSNDAQEVPV